MYKKKKKSYIFFTFEYIFLISYLCFIFYWTHILIETCCNVFLTCMLNTILFATCNVQEMSFFFRKRHVRIEENDVFRSQSIFLKERVTRDSSFGVSNGVWDAAWKDDRYICWCVIVSDDHFDPYFDRARSLLTIPRPLLTIPLPPFSIFRPPSTFRMRLSFTFSLLSTHAFSRSRALFHPHALYLHPSLSISLHSFERHPAFP